MNTVKTWDTRNCNKNEKEGTVAVLISKPKKLKGHGYKELLESLAKKAKGSDLSIQKKNKLSQIEVNVTEPNGSNEDETTNADSSFSHSQQERVDFLLRRVRYSGHAESSNRSNHATQTKKRKNNISESQCNLDISKLKEKLARCVAYECKSTTTNFVEYWVPVRLSNIQTEQYCGSLFSNARVLCSCSKHDSTKILHDILVSTRKCCDHPYLVDWSLRTSLIQGIPEPEQLDAEIKLSNKLLLLHKILLEIRKRGLRVLILYQSLGALDRFLLEIFWMTLFMKNLAQILLCALVEGCLLQKRAALNTFNDKGSGKFVCLMETRACLPSIKLASIDTVIFFNSDWNPMNDLRALHKINLDSQFEQVKVFRLYSSCTVEEKVLILTKQGMTPEGNIINIRQSTCHGLLTWGASYLFKKLDEFHNFITPDTHSFISYGESFVEDVFLELSTLLPNNDKSKICSNNSFILEVQQIGAEEMIVKEPPYVFWIKLLEGRNPRWKYFSSQSPRTRKSVQHVDELLEAFAGAETASKKCRTEAKSNVCQIPGVIRRRTRSKLQNRDKERKLSGGKTHDPVNHKVKYISEESDRREKLTSWVNQHSKAAALTKRHTPVLGNTSSTEPHSLLPTNEYDHVPSSATIQNDHTNGTTAPSFQTQAATRPLIEDSIRPLESSVQHSMGEVPLQTASIASHMTEDRREPSAISQASVSLTSLNCQPTEASQVTHSEALQSVCKALLIELEGLQKQKTELLKLHEEMNAEMAFVEEKKVLETRYNKVYINKSLAEAVMQRDNYKNATLSRVTTSCLMEEIYQLIFQRLGSSTVTRPEQVAANPPISSLPGCSVVQELNQASASERIASRSNQSCVNSCVTVPLPVTSSEVASSQPAVRQSFKITNQASVTAIPGQPLASPCTADPQLMSSAELNCSLPVQQTSGITPRHKVYSESRLETGSLSIPPVHQGMIQSLAVKPTNAETILAPRHAWASQGLPGSSMNLTSLVQLPQASVGVSTSPLRPMPNYPSLSQEIFKRL
ncbi:hypothetical protein Pfo_028771 [Paulownia fortunei]|nr:hypothetical protein Pfo_028771 [Paulownia fortunei]